MPNRKLEAIQAVKEYAQGSRYRLDAQEPAPTTGTTTQNSETFNTGLSENVWTSPVADNYRTSIDTADSGAYEAIGDIVSDLTDAENAFYDAGQETVPEGPALARWPLT
ncbi:hypothetical protein [Actinomyces ruminis]|uniref:Uncharacterized protein n=1 Tax=Actinomyces ruminis TaxID=1937003 RepID=A0ABX4MC87_9ACTO|nr:hypothetical protein [Actinomyces ruminis]PHP51314.1 hypothetical protein BW737_015235 [Actinomyces ruminis]